MGKEAMAKSGAAGTLFDLLALGSVLFGSAVLIALFLLQEMWQLGQPGMPLDDAWIHFRVAENLASGYGFSFNPGEPTSASTSPAWTALLALAYLATGQFVLPAIALGVFFYLATNVAVYHFALLLKPDRRLALIAALLCAVTGRWVWASLSGMETSFFTSLTMWGLLLSAGHRRGVRLTPILGGVLLAVAALVRPEGFLLLFLVGAEALLPMPNRLRASRRSLVGQALRSYGGLIALLSLAAIAMRVGYTWSTGGGLLGNTFLAQGLPQGSGPYTGPRLLPDIWYLRTAVRSLSTDSFLLGLLIPLGMVHWIRLAKEDPRVRTAGVVGLLWFVGLPLFNSVLAPNLRHHERYLMPLIPLAVLFGAFGIDFLVHQTLGERSRSVLSAIRRPAASGALLALVALMCLADALFDARRWSVQYVGDVQSIQTINVGLGEWIRDNTPPEAYVAMNDIGAIAFMSKRRVLDTVGIAEPGVLPYLSQRGRAGLLDYLEQKKPDYVVIWPEWYPELAARTDILKPIYSVRMDRPLTSTRDSMLGGREMVVFEAHWTVGE